MRHQRLRHHVVMTVKCYIFLQVLIRASCHCDERVHFRALDVRASSTVTHAHQTTLKITFRALPHTQAFMVLSGSRSCLMRQQQQLSRQQLALWSATSEVSTSDPSYWVEFPGPKQYNYRREDAAPRCNTWEGMVLNLVMFSLVPAQFMY